MSAKNCIKDISLASQRKYYRMVQIRIKSSVILLVLCLIVGQGMPQTDELLSNLTIRRARRQDGCKTKKSYLQLVTVEVMEPVVLTSMMKFNVACGLWSLSRCTKYRMTYTLSYEKQFKLQKRTMSECCPGWRGANCDRACSSGYYGQNCLSKCKCQGCDAVVGNCPTIPYVTTAPSSSPTTPLRRLSTPSAMAPSSSNTTWLKPTFNDAAMTSLERQTRPTYSRRSKPTTIPVSTINRTEFAFSCDGLTPQATDISPPAILYLPQPTIKLYCGMIFPQRAIRLKRELTWLRGDEPLDGLDSRSRIVVEPAGREGNRLISSLEIINVSLCDRGLYTCRGKFGPCEQDTSTTLKCPPYKVPGFSLCCPSKGRELYQEDQSTVYIAITVLLVCLLLTTVIGLPWLLYKKWWMLRIWLNYRFGGSEDNDGLLYDVYLSFNTDDVTLLRFVLSQFRQFLENKGYKVFIFPLDSLPGATQSENIVEAMEQSRRVMILFSELYRSNEWCRFEFLTAQRLFMKNRLRIVPILYGDNIKDILEDKDFSTVLGSIPVIKLFPSTTILPKSFEIAITMRMPKPCGGRRVRKPYSEFHFSSGTHSLKQPSDSIRYSGEYTGNVCSLFTLKEHGGFSIS